MKKRVFLFILVSSLLVMSLVEAISGFILWFALPSGGGRRGLELTYLGVTRHTWIDIHDWIAVALTVIVIIHLLAHWKWVLHMIREAWNNLLGQFRENPQTLTAEINQHSEIVYNNITANKQEGVKIFRK